MQIQCRSCRKPIPGVNMNVQQMVAKCDVCHAIFGLRSSDLLFPPPGFSAVSSSGESPPTAGKNVDRGFVPLERPRVAMPAGISVEQDGKDLLIRRAWYHWSILLVVVLFVVWNGFLALLLLGGLAVFTPLPAFVFAIGALLAYFCLAGLINTTTIRVDRAQVSVANGPLPWPGDHVCPRAAILQVYCVEHGHHTERGHVGYTCDVEMMLKGNLRQSLVTGLKDITQALFIEQEVERYLGLQDWPVPGEGSRW